VRSWDEFVFKRALPKTLAEPTTSSMGSNSSYPYNKGKQHWKKGGSPNGKQQQQQQQREQQEKEQKEREAVVDPSAKRDRRPQIRAILLCGPPGACVHAEMGLF